MLAIAGATVHSGVQQYSNVDGPFETHLRHNLVLYMIILSLANTTLYVWQQERCRKEGQRSVAMRIEMSTSSGGAKTYSESSTSKHVNSHC